MADTLQGAFQESYALSQGTRCTKHLFSVSLSPPKDADVSFGDFEDAIQRLEDRLGLGNQPKAIVFHEKDARRHCHVVYSRIDTDSMTAIDMPFYKNRLMEVSKDLYLEHGWTLPQGFIDRELKNPLHFSLQEWQQAKRLNDDPRLLKLALRECWSNGRERLIARKSPRWFESPLECRALAGKGLKYRDGINIPESCRKKPPFLRMELG